MTGTDRMAHLPLQRTAYDHGVGPTPAPDPTQAASPQDPGPASSGFTEVQLQRSSAQQIRADDVTESSATTESGETPSRAPADPEESLPSGRALDALVERLYEPLTARLKTELWLDRERSGLMVNLRR
ncbi:hypothetical protein MWU75_13005 [Ornithinimicrobium sp. F0845]|uniref:hypothetical protein n=1 Tax=Ornithinimicrobium sp. F0845 TaxID=2926412 RepID=UPI001FF1A0F3|nr:hypothetical protein [Ornithinimicrobium sp. F0845]MCK0113062.1 hypothetical protein [Ornithinimicrobium sp. F0845]